MAQRRGGSWWGLSGVRRQAEPTAELARLKRELAHASVERHQLPPPAPNVLEQRFVTTALNRVWVRDITTVPTQAGWLYVAVLLDLYSRRVIGWAMRAKPDQQLTLEALAMAVRQRRIEPGLIHHTDRGAQYSAVAYQRQLTALRLTPSMSRK